MTRQTLGILLLFICALLVSKNVVPAQQFPDLGSNIAQPQIMTSPDGELLLSWTARENGDYNLFVSTWDGDAFSEAVQVNTGPLNTIPIDEMRPAIAIGTEGRVALVWTDREFDIQTAMSLDGGRSFGAPIRLNQDEGTALQEFPTIAFDPEGVLHAAWMDPRIAEEGEEEPADLYYAEIRDGVVQEKNLTASQESSVCGCCLPHIQVESNGNLTITFRNTVDGYRDPFRVVRTPDGAFGEPEPVSPPVWQINLCPIAGPIAVGDMTLWFDGSTDRRRLLSSFSTDRAPDVVLEDSDEWFLDVPPRRVSGILSDTPILLLPSVPSYLLRADGHSWSVVADDLPNWATSAAVHEGTLLLVGVADGRFMHESRAFSID